MNLLNSMKVCGDSFNNAVSLVDLAKEDQPLIYVNQKFSAITGYDSKDILGRNCRFLQGELTSKNSVGGIRDAISRRQSIFQDIVNYRKNGEVFVNRLVLLFIEYAGNSYYIGMQLDISDRYPDLSAVQVEHVDPQELDHHILNPLAGVLLSIEHLDEDSRLAENDLLQKKIGQIATYVLTL